MRKNQALNHWNKLESGQALCPVQFGSFFLSQNPGLKSTGRKSMDLESMGFESMRILEMKINGSQINGF